MRHFPVSMPMQGRELRLVGLSNPNDPDEVGPPRIEAWLRYDETPARDDLQRALLAHFTGHLSISTTMRAHAGVGTSQAHKTLSTGVIAINISFHDPVVVGRLAALRPREHLGRRRDELRAGADPRSFRTHARVVQPGRDDPPFRQRFQRFGGRRTCSALAAEVFGVSHAEASTPLPGPRRGSDGGSDRVRA